MSSEQSRTSLATALTAAQIDHLRSRAEHEAGPFVDPRTMQQIERWWTPDLREWASVIVGEPVTGLRALSWRNWVLLDLAHEIEPCPPPPPELTAQRAAQQAAEEQRAREEWAAAQAKVAEWASLRTALPVAASVAFNYSRHTYAHHTNGGDHIVIWGDLHVGKLHRAAGQALCATPSRSRSLHLDNAKFERADQDAGREQTFPTCKACLDTAYRVTGHQPGLLRECSQ